MDFDIDAMDAFPRKPYTHISIYQVPDIHPEKKPLYSFFKRAADIVLALILLPLLFLPVLLLALIVRLDSPGCSFYLQERVGLNGKPFKLIKLRTMRPDAEKDGARWAEEDDSRCTRIGRFLRKSRLDELPQILNILAGQMSFVGPRPERDCFYRLFEENIHGFSYRLRVKPGLTGLAQVNGGYSLLPEQKIVYDMKYVRCRSFSMDLKCILKTVSVVFSHDGAR